MAYGSASVGLIVGLAACEHTGLIRAGQTNPIQDPEPPQWPLTRPPSQPPLAAATAGRVVSSYTTTWDTTLTLTWKQAALRDRTVQTRSFFRIMAIPAAHKLSSIEALRGVAATVVVLSHSARHIDKAFGDPALITAFQASHAGVDLFFVISGFIILFVHYPDIGQPGRLSNYVQRRFTRVMPLYWIALVLTLAMSAAGSGPLPLASSLLWSASLLPMQHEPFLGIAWTLQYEAVFYVVFAVLIVQRAAGLALFAAWLAVIASSIAGYQTASLPSGLSGAYSIEFFFGMVTAHLVRQRQVPVPMLLAVAGLSLFGMAMVFESAGLLDGFANLARFAYGIPAALLVAGLAASEQKTGLIVSAPLRLLGGASYSIYLFQFVFIGIVWQAWLKAGIGQHAPHIILFAALAFSAVIGGVLVSRFVEKPLLRLVRRRNKAIGVGVLHRSDV